MRRFTAIILLTLFGIARYAKQVNANLYPESADVDSSPGEGYYKTGDTKNAVQFLEKVPELNKDPKLVKEILKILYETRGLKEQEACGKDR